MSAYYILLFANTLHVAGHVALKLPTFAAMKKTLCASFIIAAFPFASFCQKDSVFLYNGQVLIGDVKKVGLGNISIDDIDLKLISVKLYKIKKIKTAHHFRIETSDKHIFFGTPDSHANNGWTEILTDDSTNISLPITSISSMILVENEFFRRLDGSIGAGFSFTKSNSVGQVNLNSTTSYATKNFENQFRASTIGSINSSKYSRDNESIELFSSYTRNSTWFLAGLLAYQRNLELSLNRRFQELLGVGNKLILNKNMQLFAISGISASQERYSDGTESDFLIELPAMARFNFYNFHNPNIQINTSQSIYIGITQFGRIRYSGNTDISWELVKNFSITLNLYSNFDSKPPKGSKSNIDFGIVMGTSYKF